MWEGVIDLYVFVVPGGVTSFVQVIDLQNSPGLVKGANSMKKLVSLLQDNYPELAAKQVNWQSFSFIKLGSRVFRHIPTVRTTRT